MCLVVRFVRPALVSPVFAVIPDMVVLVRARVEKIPSRVCSKLLTLAKGTRRNHTLPVLDLLCGVSKQQVARIHRRATEVHRMMLRSKGKEDNGTKHPDPIFYLPPINGCETRTHMDRRRPFSWLGLLRVRLGVQPIRSAHWQIF